MSQPTILHATSITRNGRALLIVGASGSGKSSLALQMLALGAELICDDRTALHRSGDQVIAGPAPNIGGLIEARGFGLLALPQAQPSPVAMVVDLDQLETERLPPWRIRDLLGIRVPLVHKTDTASFPAVLMLYLLHGRMHPHPTASSVDESGP